MSSHAISIESMNGKFGSNQSCNCLVNCTQLQGRKITLITSDNYDAYKLSKNEIVNDKNVYLKLHIHLEDKQNHLNKKSNVLIKKETKFFKFFDYSGIVTYNGHLLLTIKQIGIKNKTYIIRKILGKAPHDRLSTMAISEMDLSFSIVARYGSNKIYSNQVTLPVQSQRVRKRKLEEASKKLKEDSSKRELFEKSFEGPTQKKHKNQS